MSTFPISAAIGIQCSSPRTLCTSQRLYPTADPRRKSVSILCSIHCIALLAPSSRTAPASICCTSSDRHRVSTFSLNRSSCHLEMLRDTVNTASFGGSFSCIPYICLERFGTYRLPSILLGKTPTPLSLDRSCLGMCDVLCNLCTIAATDPSCARHSPQT